MSDFTAKMHQIRFRLGLRPRPRWGSLQRSPKPPGWIWGAYVWGEGKGMGWEGRGGREEKGGERRPFWYVTEEAFCLKSAPGDASTMVHARRSDIHHLRKNSCCYCCWWWWSNNACRRLQLPLYNHVPTAQQAVRYITFSQSSSADRRKTLNDAARESISTERWRSGGGGGGRLRSSFIYSFIPFVHLTTPSQTDDTAICQAAN